MVNMTRRYFLAALSGAALTTAVPVWSSPYSALTRITQQKNHPNIIKLARALERLQSTLIFMTTGAHPDDEPSSMLAALRYQYGISPVIYCITRGEGGQNNIGPERGLALGALRTREMQEACRALDARLAFGSSRMDDTVHDFGFSKNPEETLAYWGKEIVVERMVEAIRAYRPDIIFNCFNNVSGQHGHHRAAVLVTDEAVALAGKADAYPEQLVDGIDAWTVNKVYDPAWSGSGSTYDDETPPPPTTLTLTAPMRETLSGATWPQMGEWSRSCHLTQKMGRWIDAPQTEWQLSLRHNAQGEARQAEKDIRENLLFNLQSIANLPEMTTECAQALRQAQQKIDAIVPLYYNPTAVLALAIEIAQLIKRAKETLPERYHTLVAHRLQRKQVEIDQVIALASHLQARCFIEGDNVARAQEATIATLVDAPDFVNIKQVRVVARPDLSVEPQSAEKTLLKVPEQAALTHPMPAFFDPIGGNGEAYSEVSFIINGYEGKIYIDLESPLHIVPKSSIRLSPEAMVLKQNDGGKALQLEALLEHAPADALTLQLPEHWQADIQSQVTENHLTFTITPPEQLNIERLAIEPQLNGEAAYQLETFSYPHTGKVIVPMLAKVPIQIVDTKLPEAKVAYIGSNNDTVALWLQRLGIDVQALDAQAVNGGAFRDYDTVIIGVYSFGKRLDLVAQLPALHDWVRQGGHLLSLYHRPADGWDAKRVPLAYLKIGSPSIRYRVTDANAEVTHLIPEHPLLNYPNQITAEDWANWDKERGLYFAAEWDEVYQPLLSMHDPNEKPLLGALLSAEIGKGRHTHTSLILHHQLEKLTPGAFRLMANLVQKA